MKKLLLGSLLCIAGGFAGADEFSQADVERWMQQFEQVAQESRRLWTSPEIGSNGVVCAQCHPNAANTHPETYPKFQKQLGKVAEL
jgi:thiosulfate dehydrogenase